MTEPDLRTALAESTLALRAGRLDEARRGFQALTERAPAETAAWSGLARAAFALGQLQAAVLAWQRLLALAPESWQTLNDLGSAWTEMRDFDRAEAAFARAEGLNPTEALIQINRARLELRRGQPLSAIARLQAVVGEHAGSAAAQASLGFALRDTGRAAEAIAPLERAVASSPDTALYHCGLGRALLETGDAQRALATALAYLQRHPGHSGARALEALCRIGIGDAAGVRQLLDYSGLVEVSSLSTPTGYATLAAFNAALSEHAANHPSLLASPLSHATAHGLHSGSLLVEPRGPILALESAVGAAAGAYLRKRAESFGRHPLLQHGPRAVFLRMWCVVMSSGGHQIPHIHPEAWLSGVYYPRVPASLSDGAGSLEFGQPDAPFPAQSAPPTLRVQPREGTLVLFPSYFYHCTLPFQAEGARISIAFDLVPLP